MEFIIWRMKIMVHCSGEVSRYGKTVVERFTYTFRAIGIGNSVRKKTLIKITLGSVTIFFEAENFKKVKL